MTHSLIERVSLGTRLVAHFRNINAVDHFFLVDDGDVRLTFEPLFAGHRFGSDPEGHIELMRAVGFHVAAGDEEYEGHTEATFALAEEMTNVRLTPDLLNTAKFCYSTAPAPL